MVHPCEYRKKIAQIREYNVADDVYQISFAKKYQFGFEGSVPTLYNTLQQI